MKKKSIVCVFAHPDDEAFGPGGSIAKFSQSHDVYILCATKGEMGGKARVREQELLHSAIILGVKQVFFLDFKDGNLCNKIYHDLVSKIKEKVELIKPQTLMTFEPRGVSGHIDHVTVSLTTSYVFERTPFIKTLLYFCHTDWQVKKIKKAIGDYFIYFPPGYKKSQIGKTVDINAVWDIKVAAMKKHQSQIHDVNLILGFLQKLPKKEHFLVSKRL